MPKIQLYWHLKNRPWDKLCKFRCIEKNLFFYFLALSGVMRLLMKAFVIKPMDGFNSADVSYTCSQSENIPN